MKIAMAQLNFCVGDIENNADRIIKITQENDADLIVFPELALTGYPPEDLLFRAECDERCERALQKIIINTSKKAIIVGYPKRIGKKIYNKAVVIQHQKIIADYAKHALPNYTVFDEKRYFTAGEKSCVFEFNNIKMGLLICEDLWEKNPIEQAQKAGAECIISINASPYDQAQVAAREILLKKRATETQLPIIYVNLIGGQDELVFDGGSFVVDASGNRCVQANYYQEEIRIVEINKHSDRAVITPQPLPDRLPALHHVYEALTVGVRDYVQKNNFPGVLIGLSGGIDSALTLAIAADAIGADKVTAVIMPSQYTATISIEDAITEAKTLGVDYHQMNIESLFTVFLTTLAPIFKNTSTDITEENLQARIRGMLLMALSNKFGKLVLTTGNKSELSVGYATLYGDMAGGFSVIKDVPKTQVYQLAHYRNAIHAVIPERVLTRAPTAELKDNQTDQDKLPPYDILDKILDAYIEKEKSPADIVSMGFEKKIVDDIVSMIHRNEYKRRQAPIGVRLTQRAFGRDRRYPVTSRYIDLTL